MEKSVGENPAQKKQKIMAEENKTATLQELCSNLPTVIKGRILTFTVSTVWELADLRTWSRAFRDEVVPWMVTGEAKIAIKCTREAQRLDDGPFLSQLVYPNWDFLQYGPSKWDVWRPIYREQDHPQFKNDMRLFPGHVTTEIRVIETILCDDDLGNNYEEEEVRSKALEGYGKGEEAEEEALDATIDHYKEMQDLIANQWVTMKDPEKLQEKMEDTLCDFEWADMFCPPIPPWDNDEDNNDEEENENNDARANGEWFHCIVTLRRDGEVGTSTETHPLQDRFGDQIKLIQALVPLEDDKDQIFNSPPIFKGWYYPGFVANSTSTSASSNDEELIRVPMTLRVGPGGCSDGYWYLFDEYNECNFTIWSLKLDHLWKKYQSKPAEDGVAVLDGALPGGLQASIAERLAALSCQPPRQRVEDSGDLIAIVDPALACYDAESDVKADDIQEIPCQLINVPPVRLLNDKELHMRDEVWEEVQRSFGMSVYFDPDPPGVERDFWGRKYDETIRHKILPSYWSIGFNGDVSIVDDLADLSPRKDYPKVYGDLEDIFRRALPLVESVYGYCRDVRKEVRTWEGHEWLASDDHDQKPLPKFQSDGPCSLKGQKLQIISTVEEWDVKHLTNAEWKLAGRPHEEIVATVMYIVNIGDALQGGHIDFKRAYHKREARYIDGHLSGAQGRPVHKDNLISTAIQPAGRASLRKGRIIVFPNTHLWQISGVAVNIAAEAKGASDQRLTLIRMELVNPEKRILSTREVTDESTTFGGAVTRRNQLKHLRSRTTLDTNVREISLYTD